jgi:hypothetical protein
MRPVRHNTLLSNAHFDAARRFTILPRVITLGIKNWSGSSRLGPPRASPFTRFFQSGVTSRPRCACLWSSRGRFCLTNPRAKGKCSCLLMALNGRAGSQQICALLKVDRSCHRAVVTSQFDPQRKSPNQVSCNTCTTGGGEDGWSRRTETVSPISNAIKSSPTASGPL